MFIVLLLVSVVQSALTHRGVYCLIVQCTIYSSIGTVTVINGNLAIKHIIDHKLKHFSCFFKCKKKCQCSSSQYGGELSSLLLIKRWWK